MQTIGLRMADGCWIGWRVFHARTFRERLAGLIVCPRLQRDEALLLSPGRSIHTFGLRYAIDAVFLDAQLKVIAIAADVAPWRVRFAPARTRHVLELVAGRARVLELRPGTELFLARPRRDAEEEHTRPVSPMPSSAIRSAPPADHCNWKLSLKR
jgi:uncharacterized membrane protein (UPF0127 family)